MTIPYYPQKIYSTYFISVCFDCMFWSWIILLLLLILYNFDREFVITFFVFFLNIICGDKISDHEEIVLFLNSSIF